MHVCPMVTGLVPHVGGPILPPCEPKVLIGYLPAARVTDKCLCVGPVDVIVKGSPTVYIGYLPAARIGDLTAHGGVIVKGEPTVWIGDAGGGGGSGGSPGSAQVPGIGKPEAPPPDGPAPNSAQAQSLMKAAQSGTPFCEVCAAKGGK